jgi:glycosyltransferase involved in cell wall biosynthesis
MAAGLPPIATNTGGPLSFINIDPDLPTGWLVPPDDVTATAAALTEAVSNRSVRLDRGRRAAAFVRQRYSWDSAAEAFARLYREVADEHDASRTLSQSGR